MSLLDRQTVQTQLDTLIKSRDRLIVEVERHVGAIAVLTQLLAEAEPKAAVSQFPMAVNSTTTQ